MSLSCSFGLGLGPRQSNSKRTESKKRTHSSGGEKFSKSTHSSQRTESRKRTHSRGVRGGGESKGQPCLYSLVRSTESKKRTHSREHLLVCIHWYDQDPGVWDTPERERERARKRRGNAREREREREREGGCVCV